MRNPVTIDCDYLLPRFAAAYLLVEKKSAAFVENNTAHAIPKLLKALSENGLSPKDVEYVVITHVHLDHAGGTSALMKACPNAICLAHPRAAKHVRDPAKLIAGAKAVYGEKRFEQLYGEIEPVPANRVREMADGEVLRWGEREWEFLHTRGHAKHHFCLWDSKVDGIFTGDAFGICYPDLQAGGLFAFASTSPTDFEPQFARGAAHQIAARAPRAYPTHYGEVGNVKAVAQMLVEWIDFSESLVGKAKSSSLSDEELPAFCQQSLDARFRSEMEKRNVFSSEAWARLAIDRELNAAGLAHAAVRARHDKLPT